MAKIIMSSDEYGTEIFHYDDMAEAYSGLARLAEQCAKLNDEIDRTFIVTGNYADN